MKKTLITLMALAGMASATEMTDGLVAWWTFDNGATGYTSYTNFTGHVDTGLSTNHMHTEGGVDGNGYISTHYQTVDENGNPKAQAMDFYTSMSGMNISASSFTLSFKVKGVTADYRTLFSMNIGSLGQANMQLENSNNGSDTCIYLPNNRTLELTEDAARAAMRGSDGWANVILTGDGTTLTLYVDDFVATFDYSGTTGDLSNFQLGSLWGDGSRRVEAQYDDLAIWNRVLSTEEVSLLSKGAVADGTLTIPEPTTATLSLLALAGLAARRRRK